MLIIGAKGFAKEVLEILQQLNQTEELAFYDDINEDIPHKLFDKFPVIRTKDEALYYFAKVDNKFAIGIGNPLLRKKMYELFSELGGVLSSTISPNAHIGSYDIKIGMGCNILPQVVISNGAHIGKGVLIYYNSIITHDVIVGDFVEISPDVKLLGHVKIGDYCQIGTGSIILPRIKLGNNVVIGAGSVVTKDIPDNSLVFGIPAKFVRKI